MRKIFAVLFLATVFSGVVQSSGTDWMERSKWNNIPNYFEDSSVDVSFSDDVEKKVEYKACDEYDSLTYNNGTTYGTDYSDCLSYTTDYRGGENIYIFGIENIEYYYIGNGNVHLEFDITKNDLTKELFKSQKNPRQQEKFIDYFNSNYLFRNQVLDRSNYSDLLDFAESVSVSSLGDSVKAKNLESKNLMAASNSRVKTVVKLENFRKGGVKLNNAVTVEVSS